MELGLPRLRISDRLRLRQPRIRTVWLWQLRWLRLRWLLRWLRAANRHRDQLAGAVARADGQGTWLHADAGQLERHCFGAAAQYVHAATALVVIVRKQLVVGKQRFI